MSEQVNVSLDDGQVVRTRDDQIEVVEESTGRVVHSWAADAEVRVDGVKLPKPGEVETR